MAILFNGTTSKLEHTSAPGLDVDHLTLLYWCYVTGAGEPSGGVVLAAPENAVSFFVFRPAADTQRLRYNRSVVDGNWNFTVPENQWAAVAIAYDRSAAANNPVVRVDFSDAAVTPVGSPPDGSPVAPSSGYCIGNTTSQARTFDGRLAHVQFFDRLLSAGECDSGLRRPGSILHGLVLWLPMFHASWLADMSGSGNTPTATDLTSADPPPARPWFGLDDAPSATAPAAPAVRRGGLLLAGCGR